MKKIKMSALVLAAASIASTGVMAQSSKTNAWEGAYGQVAVGYGTITPSIPSGSAAVPAGALFQSPSLSPAFTGTTSASNVNNINTVIGNIAGGYNFAINSQYVLGIGVSYDPGASASATGQLGVTAPVNPYLGPASGQLFHSETATYQMKNVYSVTLNPGYSIDKDRLAYLMLGYTGATVGLSSPGIAYNTINLNGYTVGLGYKQMVSESIFMLGEIKYGSFGQKTATSSIGGVVPVSQPLSANGMEFLVGVGYRF